MDEHFVKEVSKFFADVKAHDAVKLVNGKFGSVSVIRHAPTDKLFVRKVIDGKHFCYIEPMVHGLMRNNSHFVKLYYSFSTLNKHVLVLDYIRDGDLFDWTRDHGAMPEPDVRNVARQLSSALNALHKHHIIHNDVKLENVLYNKQKRVYICDYGLCKIVGTRSEQDGTLDYFSPEKIRMHDYSFAMDWWSVGVLTYELLAAQHPFKTDADERVSMDVMERRHQTRGIAQVRRVSAAANDFVRAMLQFDMKRRMCAYSAICNHDFIK